MASPTLATWVEEGHLATGEGIGSGSPRRSDHPRDSQPPGAEVRRYRSCRAVADLRALGTESEERQKLGQVHQSLSLLSFRRRERGAGILTVEQRLKPILNTWGQSESCKIVRDLQLDGDNFRHTTILAIEILPSPDLRAIRAAGGC
jgi:hypothetical protein